MTKHEELKQFWSPAFDNMEDFVFLIDDDFNIVETNKTFADFAKKDKAYFVGKKCYQIVHSSGQPINECPHKEMLKTGHFEKTEFYESTLKKWLSVSVTPVFSKDSALIGSIHIVMDITEHKKIDAELHKKIYELERFQKITVDRELRMKELKAKIAELEARCSG